MSSITLFNAVPAGAIEVLTDANGVPHFKRADLGRFLGIVVVARNNNNIATKSRSELSRSGEVKTSRSGMRGGGENPHDAFVDQETAMMIITRSNKPKAAEILEKMGSNIYQHKYVRKETTTMSHIQDAFKGEEMIDQYGVDGYRIDLYFPAYKLAIECDEFNHNDRDVEYEVRRQNHIENKLGCHFIRYNPDAGDFNIFRVINRIYQHLR